MEVMLLTGMFYIALALGLITFIRLLLNRTHGTDKKIQQLESRIKLLEDEIMKK
jgi:hypothetical protein